MCKIRLFQGQTSSIWNLSNGKKLCRISRFLINGCYTKAIMKKYLYYYYNIISELLYRVICISKKSPWKFFISTIVIVAHLAILIYAGYNNLKKDISFKPKTMAVKTIQIKDKKNTPVNLTKDRNLTKDALSFKNVSKQPQKKILNEQQQKLLYSIKESIEKIDEKTS